MKNNRITIFKEKIYFLTKALIKINYSKLFPFFESSWNSLMELIMCVEDVDLQKWFIDNVYPAVLHYPSSPEESAKFKIYSIALTLYASMEDLSALDEEPNHEKAVKIIKAHAERLHVHDSIIPDIASILLKLFNIKEFKQLREALPEIKREEKEKKKYVMYSHDFKAGEPLTENEVEQRAFERNDYILWLDMTKKVAFVKGVKVDFDPLHKRILAYLIIKKGMVATYQELYEKFCKLAKDKYYEWDESLRGTVYRWFSDIQKRITMNRKLNNKEKDRFRDFIINEPNDGYRIDTELDECKCCLIETKHI